MVIVVSVNCNLKNWKQIIGCATTIKITKKIYCTLEIWILCWMFYFLCMCVCVCVWIRWSWNFYYFSYEIVRMVATKWTFNTIQFDSIQFNSRQHQKIIIIIRIKTRGNRAESVHTRTRGYTYMDVLYIMKDLE